MNTAEIILSYAEGRRYFTFADLSRYIRANESISDSGILWHIKRLVNENKISRLARGMYGSSTKRHFAHTLDPRQRAIYHTIVNKFPLIDVCVYSGADISSMQHHLSANNATYIEVTKEATEVVFHCLLDNGFKAYHRPTQALMTEYVNLSDRCVIVKPLISESPLTKTEGIHVPTLEKMLVDINADPDFYYLQGNETPYIMEHARNLYNINEPKMLRYASRRGIRQKMTDLLNHTES